MEIPSYIYHNCVNLTSINDTVFWSNNVTKPTIVVQPINWQPFVTYVEDLKSTGNTSLLHYQYCGPLIFMLKIFAIQMSFK